MVETVPLKSVTQADVIIKCIKEILYIVWPAQNIITVNYGSMFTWEEIKDFTHDYRFEIIHSNPYYAQANGQAESTNKLIKANIVRMVDQNPRVWHEILSEV